MKNNNTYPLISGPDQLKENQVTRFNQEWFPEEGSWTEFDNSFIQLLTGAEPARKYYNHIDIHQQITC